MIGGCPVHPMVTSIAKPGFRRDMFRSTIGATVPNMDDLGPSRISRRSFLKGAAMLSALAGAGCAGLFGFFLAIDQSAWAADNHNTTLGLPGGTAPEQVHLTWGSDPSTAVTVSWA